MRSGVFEMADAKAAAIDDEAEIEEGAEGEEAAAGGKKKFKLPSMKMLIIIGGAPEPTSFSFHTVTKPRAKRRR
jgi:hypothetical protein